MDLFEVSAFNPVFECDATNAESVTAEDGMRRAPGDAPGDVYVDATEDAFEVTEGSGTRVYSIQWHRCLLRLVLSE